MKFLIPFFAAVLLCSCSLEKNPQSDDTLLLTSTVWEATDEKSYEIITMNADGTFETKMNSIPSTTNPVDPITIIMRGRWHWGANREIITNHTEIVLNDESHVIDDPDHRYVLRITELSKEKLVGISRNIYDAEDSGFAHSVTYTAKAM